MRDEGGKRDEDLRAIRQPHERDTAAPKAGDFRALRSLTRVASGRLLDHIVVTGEAEALMPERDRREMLIIRHDKQVSDFTKSLSDHVPVAVRFVIGEDRD